MHPDLKYYIALSILNGLGDISAKKLIAYCKSAEAVFKENKQALLKIPGIGEHFASVLIQAKSEALNKADAEIEFIQKNKINTSVYSEPDYPFLLKNAEDSPIVLYYRGNLNLNNRKLISIVGTRNATEYGKEFCIRLIDDLKLRGHDPVIISGLAYGIDITAHKAALKNNLTTMAVLAHGLDLIYPANHAKYASQMLETGAVITDFPSKSNFDRQNFLRRNRIIAAISSATIVIESAKKGGSLVTAELANSYNRDVFAVPGRNNDEYSEGCNQLIKINKAHLLQSAADLEYILGWESLNSVAKPIQTALFADLSIEEQNLLDIIRKENKIDIDSLSALCNKPVSKLNSILLNMEFKGVIRNLPGKIFIANV